MVSSPIAATERLSEIKSEVQHSLSSFSEAILQVSAKVVAATEEEGLTGGTFPEVDVIM